MQHRHSRSLDDQVDHPSGAMFVDEGRSVISETQALEEDVNEPQMINCINMK